MYMANPLEILEKSLDAVASNVHLAEAAGPSSHTVVVVSGLDAAVVTTAFGRYLVGVLAGAVEHDARLSAALLPTGPAGKSDVGAAVKAVVGATNAFTTQSEIKFRDTARNAWIGEGVAHALLVVRSRVETCCLAGPVQAISKPHDLPSMPGLDAVAIYAINGEPFVAIGESKATEAHGLDELRNAAGAFAKVDAAVYGATPSRRSRNATRRLDPRAQREGHGRTVEGGCLLCPCDRAWCGVRLPRRPGLACESEPTG